MLASFAIPSILYQMQKTTLTKATDSINLLLTKTKNNELTWHTVFNKSLLGYQEATG